MYICIYIYIYIYDISRPVHSSSNTGHALEEARRAKHLRATAFASMHEPVHK